MAFVIENSMLNGQCNIDPLHLRSLSLSLSRSHIGSSYWLKMLVQYEISEISSTEFIANLILVWYSFAKPRLTNMWCFEYLKLIIMYLNLTKIIVIRNDDRINGRAINIKHCQRKTWGWNCWTFEVGKGCAAATEQTSFTSRHVGEIGNGTDLR